MKNEPIQAYILKNEQNLRIAAAVGEAWPDVRESLVSGFLTKLDSRLKRRLRGWKSEVDGRFFVSGYSGYYVWKLAWDEGPFAIGLQCFDHGEKMMMGVSRSTDNLKKVPPMPALLSAVREIHESAKANVWWEAQVRMHSPASDWRKPEALWRMHNNPEFLESVATQLLEIAAKSEPILDRLAKKRK